MLTQAIPSLTRALQGVLEPNQLKALTQSLGNCVQPLSHRGGVMFSGQSYDSRGGEYPGNQWGPGATYNFAGDSWNINNYGGGVNNFLNNTYEGDSYIVDYGDINNVYNRNNVVYNIFNGSNGDSGPIRWPGFVGGGGGGGGGGVGYPYPPGLGTTNNYYNSQFFFPTTQFFNQNIDNRSSHFFGGDSFFNNSTHNNLTTNNINTTNINVTNINGRPVEGPAGPPGSPGRDGAPGAPGAPGAVVGVPVPIIFPPPGNIGLTPRDYKVLVPGSEPFVEVPKYKLVGEPSFDPDTCTIGAGTLAIVQDGTIIVNVEGGPAEGTITVFEP